MRQNAIKVEETNQMIEFVECDSSDISESMHETQKEYYYEKLVRYQGKLNIKDIDLASEQIDHGFFVYRVKDFGHGRPAYILSKKKETKNQVRVSP